MFKFILIINNAMQQLVWNSGHYAIKVTITIHMYILKIVNKHLEKNKFALPSDGFDEGFKTEM